MSQAGVITSSGGGGGGISVVSAGLGINVNTVGSTATVTNTGIIKYVSPEIDFKVVGTTTLFTTASTLHFYTIGVTILIDNSVAANQDGTFNLGWTPAAYADFGTGFPDQWSGPSNYNNGIIGGNNFFLTPPTSTAVVCNVTSGDTGTTQLARLVFIGFYA